MSELCTLCTMNNNEFASLIFNKPIKSWFKERVYYHTKVKPVYKKLLNETASFETMCEFSDFIKILEMSYFYHNDARYDEKIDTDIRILSDNKINDDTKKNLIILLEKEHVTITFDMYKEMVDNHETLSNDFKRCIDIKCRNEFGKKVETKFNIVNSQVINEEINNNTYCLLFNINHILNKAMGNLFLRYYKKA